MSALLADLGDYRVGWALFASLAAGGAFLHVVWIPVIAKIGKMHYMYIWGSLTWGTASNAAIHTLGFLTHMIMISIPLGMVDIAVIHALGVDSVGEALGWGLLIGLWQSTLFLTFIPMLLSAVKPPVRFGHDNNPGFLLLGFGKTTPFFVILENVVFGAVACGIYAWAVL
jgi:hypothetical protein